MRRHAVQIVAQLPEAPADALGVLELARELVEEFLTERPQPRLRAVSPAEVVSISAASASSALSLPGNPSSLPR